MQLNEIKNNLVAYSKANTLYGGSTILPNILLPTQSEGTWFTTISSHFEEKIFEKQEKDVEREQQREREKEDKNVNLLLEFAKLFPKWARTSLSE